MRRYDPSELFASYREYLGLSQSQLAREMGITPTSISRWESGQEPVTIRTMNHLTSLVTQKLQQTMPRVFSGLIPKLKLSEFVDIFGLPTPEITEDRDGRKYVGCITIGNYHGHSFHFSLEDGNLYALGRDGSATLISNEFWQKIRKKADR